MNPTKKETPAIQNWLFALILVAFLIYSTIFIVKMVFYVDEKPYTALFDDAMISMTYARNLAEGYGMVWNPGGERVEGFTNPLWVVFMAGVHLLPIPENWTSLPIQISGALFLLGSLFYLRKMALNVSPGQSRVMLLTVLLTAFYYPLINWSLIGLEVSVLLLWINIVVFLMLRVLDTGKFSRIIYILMGIATLIRMDAAVTYLTIWGLLFIFDKNNRRRHLLEGGFFLLIFMGGQTILRKLYYGEWLPNTYYLKVEGWPLWSRVQRGFTVFIEFTKGFFWPLMILPFTVFIFRRDRKTLILALVYLAQVIYSIYVGGDSWEHRGGSNRFISLGMPSLFLLFSMACFYWYDWGMKLVRRFLPKGENVIRPVAISGLSLFLILSILMWNRMINNGGPITNLQSPTENNLRFFLLLQRSIYMPGSERYAIDGLMIRELTEPGARVATVAAGNICYFMHRECIDLFGKSDPVIAHAGIQVPFDSHWKVLKPGHVKFNYEYSIGQLQPDVVVELASSTVDLGLPFVENYTAPKINRHTMYFKNDSPFVHWDKLEEMRED
ncbi:MAG: hypothetical protein CVU39_13340 [Chloroflexi bacterium HGW-Chloroflexi-10]|nr:MAG: hypothetical protein CVU39_13340 [Chloroflexi bacterium HGW-Chloroflexi-10]